MSGTGQRPACLRELHPSWAREGLGDIRHTPKRDHSQGPPTEHERRRVWPGQGGGLTGLYSGTALRLSTGFWNLRQRTTVTTSWSLCQHWAVSATGATWADRRPAPAPGILTNSPGWHGLLRALLQLSDLLLYLLWLSEVTHEVEMLLHVGPVDVLGIVNPQLLQKFLVSYMPSALGVIALKTNRENAHQRLPRCVFAPGFDNTCEGPPWLLPTRCGPQTCGASSPGGRQRCRASGLHQT